MGQQQMNPLTQHAYVSHMASQHKTAAHQRGLQQICTTCQPCPVPANMKHTAVCFNVQGHATDTTIHAQYCRLHYGINYKRMFCIIILEIIYMTIKYDLHIATSRIRTCVRL